MRIKANRWVLNHMHRERDQLRRDTFRAGGKGGQNQNKVETGVRITDLVTGLSAEGREHRTQLQNQKAAFERLVTLLQAHYQAKWDAIQEKRFSAPTGIIRTYNEKRGEVVDHRDKSRTFPLRPTLDGDLSPLISHVLTSTPTSTSEKE